MTNQSHSYSLRAAIRISTVVAFTTLWLIIGSFFASSAFAYGEPWSPSVHMSQGKDLRIRLVTFGPGDGIAEKFGHTAIWVSDERLKYERLYNFGMFNFDKTLIPQFLSGRLRFWVEGDTVPYTFDSYRLHNRDIFSDELNLPPDKKLEMARALAVHTQPENRYYIYDHYYDNCSTRVRDAINTASGNVLYKSAESRLPYTLRDYTSAYTQSSPIVYFAIMFWLNDDIDHPLDNWDAMFLPLELQRVVEQTKYPDGEPLVSESEAVFRSLYRAPLPAMRLSAWPYFFLTSLIILLATSLIALWYTSSYSFVPRFLLGLIQFVTAGFFGFLGTVLVLMNFSNQVSTHYNVNLLLANPLTFLLAFCGLGIIFNSRRAFRFSQYCWTFLAGSSTVVFIASPFLLQDSSVSLAMLLPINLGFAVIFWVIRLMGTNREL